MNISNSLQTGLIGINRGLDNVAKASSDFTGSGKPENPEEATGRQPDQAVVESAAGREVEAAATKVVSQAIEPGEPGAIINIRV